MLDAKDNLLDFPLALAQLRSQGDSKPFSLAANPIDNLAHPVCHRKRLRKNVYGTCRDIGAAWRDRAGGALGMMNVVLVGCGAMSKAWLDAAREIPSIAVVGLVDLDADRAQARAREFELDGVAIGTNLDADPRPDQARCRVRRRRARRAPRRGALGLRPWLPSADRKAARRQPRECARHRRGAPGRQAASMPSCRTAATSPMSGASGAFSIPARSARRPAFMPTSSSRRISAGSARRCAMCCCSTWRSIPSTPRATW